MTLRRLQLDAATMKAGAAAFTLLAESGADYARVFAELRDAGVHGNATHRFITSMERATGRRLPGDRPADVDRQAVENGLIGEAIRLNKSARGMVVGRYKATGTRVVSCPTCSAPVVDSQRAREGHCMRTGCKG